MQSDFPPRLVTRKLFEVSVRLIDSRSDSCIYHLQDGECSWQTCFNFRFISSRTQDSRQSMIDLIHYQSAVIKVFVVQQLL